MILLFLRAKLSIILIKPRKVSRNSQKNPFPLSFCPFQPFTFYYFPPLNHFHAFFWFTSINLSNSKSALILSRYSLHDDVHHASLAVVCRAHEVHASLLYQLASHSLLSGRVIIYGNGMAAVLLNHLHAGHIGFSISEVDHSRKRDRALVIRNILVHPAVVAHLTDALVDLEEKLRLRGIIHGYGWPVGDAILIIEKRAGVDVLEFLGDGGALYHLLQSRGVDVVLDVQSDACCHIR